jgi:hypothetical protein
MKTYKFSELNELNASTYRSAIDVARGRGDDKGKEIAAKAYKSLGKAIARDLKGKEFIIKPSNLDEFNNEYGYDSFNNKARPYTGQYLMKFTGEGETYGEVENFDANNATFFLAVTFKPAKETGSNWGDNFKMLGYHDYEKKGFIQLTVSGDKVFMFNRQISLQVTRQGARTLAKVGADIAAAIGGDPSLIKHNNIKQFTEVKPVKENLRHLMTRDQFLNEAKAEYKVYHNMYSSVINEIEKYAKSLGYELGDDYGNAYVDSFFKPKNGNTKKDSLTLYKNGKEQRKALHVQIYGENDKFELNMYIN